MPSERMLATIKAIAELEKHGLRISSFVVKPETIASLDSEYVNVLTQVSVNSSDANLSREEFRKKYPRTYCGITVLEEGVGHER